MKYFLMGTDEANYIHYYINKNHALDIRFLTKEKVDRLPLWNVLEMEFPGEGFFPDLLCRPCIMMSEMFMKTVIMYSQETIYRTVKLWDKRNGINATYFLPILEEAECMSEKTEFNSIGNRVEKLVLDRNKMEEGVDKKLSDDEYLRLFKQAYDTINQKGGFFPFDVYYSGEFNRRRR